MPGYWVWRQTLSTSSKFSFDVDGLGNVGFRKWQCSAHWCQRLSRLKSWCDGSKFQQSLSLVQVFCVACSCILTDGFWVTIIHKIKDCKSHWPSGHWRFSETGMQPARSQISQQYVWSFQLAGRQSHNSLRQILHRIQQTFHT